MFLMLAQIVRLARLRRGLTQQQLASLAGVSRRQLALLEKGENVTLRFLVKIAGVLELSELPLDGLRLRALPPELSAIVEAAHAVTLLKDAMGNVASIGVTIDDVSAKLDTLLHAALPGSPPDPRVEEFSSRLENLPDSDRTKVASAMRAMAEDRIVRRVPRARKTASPSSSRVVRKRAR